MEQRTGPLRPCACCPSSYESISFLPYWSSVTGLNRAAPFGKLPAKTAGNASLDFHLVARRASNRLNPDSEVAFANFGNLPRQARPSLHRQKNKLACG